jgi:NADH-quinone oxidoreductase subunit F
MLEDKDRIFTNLYGMHDRSLAGARARGHWDGTGEILAKGRDWIVNEVKASGLRRPGRRRASPTGLNGPSCPRSRTGAPPTSSSTPTKPSPGPARTARSCATTRHTWSRAASSPPSPWARTLPHLHPRRVRPREGGAPDRAIAEAYDAGLIGPQRLRLGLGLRPLRHPRRRAPTSAARRRRCSSRSKARRGMPRMKPPFPAGAGLYWLPHDGQQRGVDRVAPTILRRGAAGSPPSGGQQLGDQAVRDLRPCEQAVRGRGRPCRSPSWS